MFVIGSAGADGFINVSPKGMDTFKIIDVYCEWIKIECKGVIGWVESERICGNPVTTCP